MARIPDNIIESVLDRASIVDVISEDITLKRAGVNYKGLCPFHADKTPSFVVSPAKGICKCFACGKGGNVAWYLTEAHNMTYREAIVALGDRYGIKIPDDEMSDEEAAKSKEKESVKVAINAAQSIFVENLEQCAEAIDYISGRGITADTIRTYGIGYSGKYYWSTMTSKSYTMESLIKADLVRRSEEGRSYETFRERIMLPYYNRRGEIIGYTGRALTSSAHAKYLNNNDTILFNKGSVLWGLYQANRDIRRLDKVYIVEGQFDVLSLYQNGVKNVIAGSGTSFTETQSKLICGLTNNVTFIYDGDEAGVKAAEKNLPKMVAGGYHVRCVRLPEGADPDDMAQKLKEKTGEWLTGHEISYVKFLYGAYKREDAFDKLESVKKIIEVIIQESEKVVRDELMSELSDLSGCDLQTLTGMSYRVKTPKRESCTEDGIYGYELAQGYIDKDNPTITLTSDFSKFLAQIGEERPAMFYKGIPSNDEVQKLTQLADKFIVLSPDSEPEGKKEPNDFLFMKSLVARGATVDVCADMTSRSFIYYYVMIYGAIVKETTDMELRNHFIQLCAELISKTNEANRTINLPAWADSLGLKQQQLKDILRPYLKEKQSKARIQQEGEEVYADLIGGDLERLPDYVNDSDEYRRTLRRYKFYPQLNSKSVPVCYIFRDDNGSLHRVGDFYLEPLFHIYSTDKEKNLRVCRLNSMTERSTYIAWPSSVFVKLSSVQEMLVNEGGYNFENGTSADWNRIWGDMSHKFPKCNEVLVYGQQKEGCFVFANAIYHEIEGEWKLELADELGLMHHEDMTLYSPSFSKVNAKMRDDNDKYEQDRWLVYSDTPMHRRITFERWASLMDEVYKVNDNGKWALIFAILCAFRSDIHPINRLFTSIFFLGPTMSGKTQIAVSIRSLFIKPDAPCFNLNSGTDAAFFSVLERYRDVPQVMEEYNDEMISDTKFQGLKSVTYDGDGKQKRKAATGNDIETSKVNAPVVLLGQESPQKDDNALSNRVVLRNVPKAERFDEHAQAIFQQLKEAEKDGLTYILLEILKLRPKIRKHYHETLKSVIKEIQTQVEKRSQPSGDQTRVIITVSMFAAMVKFIITYAPELKLPFTYEQFLALAIEQVAWQVGMLVGTDKIATFFNTFSSLLDAGIIKEGRDYSIRRTNRVNLQGGKVWETQNGEAAVIYFNLTNVHDKYNKHLGAQGKPLSLQTLTANLTSNSAWIGQVKNWRFAWRENEAVPVSEIMDKQPLSSDGKPNMATTMVMKDKTKITSAVVLNYDVLSTLYSIDLERDAEKATLCNE